MGVGPRSREMTTQHRADDAASSLMSVNPGALRCRTAGHSFDQRQFGTASNWGKVLVCFEPMEDAMSQADEREPAGSAPTAVHHFLSRLRDWWRRRSELGTMDPEELERIAKDLGMTGPELKDLAARGPDAAHL